MARIRMKNILRMVLWNINMETYTEGLTKLLKPLWCAPDSNCREFEKCNLVQFSKLSKVVDFYSNLNLILKILVLNLKIQ